MLNQFDKHTKNAIPMEHDSNTINTTLLTVEFSGGGKLMLSKEPASFLTDSLQIKNQEASIMLTQKLEGLISSLGPKAVLQVYEDSGQLMWTGAILFTSISEGVHLLFNPDHELRKYLKLILPDLVEQVVKELINKKEINIESSTELVGKVPSRTRTDFFGIASENSDKNYSRTVGFTNSIALISSLLALLLAGASFVGFVYLLFRNTPFP